MRDFKRYASLFVLCLATVMVLGCDDDDDNNDSDTSTAGDVTTDNDGTSTTGDDMTTSTGDDMTTSTGDDMTTSTGDDMTTSTDDMAMDADMTNNFPPAPTLGTQIDRAGRSAVSTALVGRFGEATAGDTLRDQYNAAGPADWETFTTDIGTSLAILDSLNVTCGDQLLADGIDPDAPDAPPRYGTLAAVLTADNLVLDSAQTTCAQYFGAELGVLGLVSGDCGGRTALYDTVDVTYSALAIGMVAGVGDGVASDDVTHSVDTFPYLAAP